MTRGTWAALAAVCAVGAALRLIGLGHAPPALWFDEGLNGLNALGVLRGEWPYYFGRHGLPQEPVHMYALATVLGVVGPGVFAIRLTSALVGIATLPVAFGCFREVFHANRLALLATAGLAVMRWHVHFSRMGLRTIWVPLIAAAACWAALVALRRPRARTAVLLGLILALGCHTYLAARLIPFVLFALLVWDATHRAYRPGLAKTIAIAAAVFVLGIAPLVVHLMRNPDLLQGRVAEISLFGGSEDETDEEPPWAPIGQGRRVLGGIGENLPANLWTFTSWGDHVPKHNIPRLPIFDPITGALMAVGLLAALGGWGHALGRALLVMWLAILLVASVLSFGAPNALRTLGAAPAAIGLAVLGLSRVSAAVDRRWGRRAAATLTGAWLAWFAVVETARYAEWSRRVDVWEDFSGREFTVAQAVRAIPESEPVGVFEGWLGHDAFAFLLDGRALTRIPSDPLSLDSTGRTHVFLLTELDSQRQLKRELQSATAATHRLTSEPLRLPNGRMFAHHLILDPADAL